MKVSLLIAVVTASILPMLARSARAQYQPVFNNTHVLTNGALTVEVMDPTAPDRQDRSVRFSPLAFVIQINHRGTNYLYAPSGVTDMVWNSDPTKYPAGAPLEYDLSDFNILPPGFDQTTRGANFAFDEFIKIGVGILQNNRTGSQRNNYSFSHDYPLAVSSQTQVAWRSDGATFTQSLPRESDSGFRYELTTDLQLSGDHVEFAYRLTNNGSQAFTTAQYVHNFTQIDAQPVGPDYEVEVPWSFTAEGLNSRQPVTQDGRKLVYGGPISGGNKPTIPVDEIGNLPFEFTVRQTSIGRAMNISAGLPPDAVGATAAPLAVSVWSTDATQLSPEQFVRIDLEPGQTIEWTRTYQIVPEPALGQLLAMLWLAISTFRRPVQ